MNTLQGKGTRERKNKNKTKKQHRISFSLFLFLFSTGLWESMRTGYIHIYIYNARLINQCVPRDI